MIQKPQGYMETTLQSIISDRNVPEFYVKTVDRTKFLCANCTKAFAIFSKKINDSGLNETIKLDRKYGTFKNRASLKNE